MNARHAAEKIIAEALQLPIEERSTIIEALLSSMPLSDDDHGPEEAAEAVDAAWRDEIARRLTDISSGRVQMVSSEEAWSMIDGATRSQR